MDQTYVGQELDIFAHAKNWKRYWSSKVRPRLQGDVLEVGAGLGSNTSLLLNPSAVRSWTCLEPDPNLAARLRTTLAGQAETAFCEAMVGTTQVFAGNQARFDAILYIDVLEHIENDQQELESAARLLRSGGMLVVLSPAHPWLYTPFDRAIGHFRRYTRKSLMGCTPPSCDLERFSYLDAFGMLASIGNRLLLSQANPSLAQIQFWDGYLVPFSTILDPLFGFGLGKSALAMWKKR